MKIIQNILLAIGMVLMMFFYTLVSVVKTPFLALRYRKSPFARDTGAAYAAGITEQPVYQLYNALRERGIPIDAAAHPKAPTDAHLIWKGTLVIHEIDRVAFRDGQWFIGPGSPVWKEGLELKTAIAEVLDDVFDDRPGSTFDNAVLLLDRSGIAPDSLRRAEVTPLFLLYSDPEERQRVLAEYCAAN